MSADNILFHDPGDWRSRAALNILLEFCIPFELATLNRRVTARHLAPEFVRLNPALNIPAFAVRGAGLSISLSDIAAFADRALNRTAGSAPAWLLDIDALPVDALAEAFLPAVERKLQDYRLRRNQRLAVQLAEREPDIAYHYQRVSVELENRLAFRPSKAATESQLRSIDAQLDRFEHHIDGREFAAGDDWSAADAIWSNAINALLDLHLVELIGRKRRPHTAQYFRKMATRSCFKDANRYRLSTAARVLRQAVSLFAPSGATPHIRIPSFLFETLAATTERLANESPHGAQYEQ